MFGKDFKEFPRDWTRIPENVSLDDLKRLALLQLINLRMVGGEWFYRRSI